MRRRLGVALLAMSCAAHPPPEPDATTDVVRAAVAPGEALDLTRQTLIHDQEYPATRAQVWDVLARGEEDFALPLESADSATGTVVFHVQTTTPRIAGRHASAWLDCGRGPGGVPRVNTYQLMLRLTAVVESMAERQVRVRTALVGYARDRSLISDPLPCTSTGKLEQRTLAILAARLTP